MKKLIENKLDYKKGAIPKAEYIDIMYQNHAVLFEYADFIKDTDIEKIEISNGEVIMVTKDSGIKILCAKGDKRIAPIEILNFDHYEKSELDFTLKLIDKKSTVFDIGANYGWYSFNIAKSFPDCKIYAFEPIPRTYSYLKTNIELNKFSNININNFGFSDVEKEIPFYYYPEGSANASAANLTNTDSVVKINCPVIMLDNFVAKNNVGLDFIKCDIEGAELLAFKGGLKSIAKYKPVIFTEMLRKWSEKFNYHPNEIIKLLTDIGYGCFVIDGDYLKPFYKMDEQTIETNFFFLHLDHHKKKINMFLK
ncbi:MAG: FkbM family methyltransferase [Patescibacteria group bacterium]|jgi:FkbM family methyltransferase